MGYPALYRKMENAHKEIIEIIRDFGDLRKKTDEFVYRLKELARDAAKIEDEEKRERFESVLLSLSERFHEFVVKRI